MLFLPETLVLMVLLASISAVHFGLRARTPTIELVFRKLSLPLKITSTSVGWLCLENRDIRVSYQRSDKPNSPEIIGIYLHSRSKRLELTYINGKIARIESGAKTIYAPGVGSLSVRDHLNLSSIRQVVQESSKPGSPVYGQKPAA